MSHVRRWAQEIGAVTALFLCLTSAALAQSDTAAISGFVRDPSGGTIPNASVSIKNEATGTERKATTNDAGYYIVSSLPPAFYTVSVEATGFKRYEKTNNKLDPNIATTVDANMTVGQATEVVNVVSEAAAIQSETATVGKLITTNEIKNIPLNGRNPLLLALLKPGVSGGALAGFSFGLTTGGLNINGSRTQDNLIAFDGAVAVRTRSNGTSIGVADVDAVQEIQVLTANYNAEYGRSSGGQVRIVTKSGGRDFHVDLYEYFRNSAMNANSWARNRNPNPEINSQAEPFRFNQFGYAASGPVFIPKVFNKERNKLFWLFSQEWVRFRQTQLNNASGIRVPSEAMRRGDFRELLTAPNAFYTTPQYIRDPNATGACSAADQTACFANNVIPTNRLSPQGLALLRSYPTANINLPGANFQQARGASQNQRKINLAMDYLPASAHYLRLRWQKFDLEDAGAFRGETDRAPATLTRPNDTASLNYIWTIGPTVVNEALFAASADRVRIAVQTDGDRYRRSAYGITYPYLFPQKEIFDKIPTVEIQNFGTIDGGPYPSSSAGPIYQFSDSLTWIKGTHTLKFGGYLERSGQNDFDQINVTGVPGGTNNQNGRFVFNNTRPGGSGLAISDAALGLYNTYAELGNRSYTPYRGHMFEAFAQDSWKATNKLRIEYGIRFTRIQPYYSLWGNQLVFDEASYNPARAATLNPANGFVIAGDLAARYNGMIIPGDSWPEAARGRVPIADSGEFNFLFKGEKQYSQIHNVWSPRLGLAYQLDSKTVVRAGVGRFVTRLGISDSVFLGGNPPLQPTVSTSNGLVDNPAGAGVVSGFPQTVTTQDPIFKNPEAWTWNGTMQRELSTGLVLEVGYVGRKSLHGQRERNLNQLQPGTVQANPGISVDFLRPYKGFATIRTTNNESDSFYNGLQLNVSQRFRSGLSFSGAYTYSKLSDDGSNQRDIIPNAFDANNLWGPSEFDRRHVAVFNAIYELPIFRGNNGLLGKALGGWQLSGVAQMQTGTPRSIATGDDFAGVGPGSGGQFWRVNGDPVLSRGDRKFSEGASDSNFWFKVRNDDATSVFTRPAAGTFVTESVRNIIYRTGFQNYTAALFKTFAITERHRVQFRGEVYNVPNHPNWNDPDINPTSATFGKVTAKNFERNFQLSLRYSF
ncbi:MAG: TonB-dependent receptor [Bryobacteraceae bacterium]|nr:TonB-dependent receptor [Bryobacteraceae bacterium]